jgi:predicted nucleic acid-binding protein
MIVADAGPLIAFSRIGRLSLLQQVVGQVVIPDAVYAELTERGRERPGAPAIARETWIQRQTVDDSETAPLPPRLGAGEREAIRLAASEQATFLSDDRSAREEAERRGIEVIGSLWILAEAKRRGLITEVRPLIDALLANGYWMHPERVVRPFLDAMGEG